MTIGIVLSQPPVYSETFFNSKIKGLQESGFQVVLFVNSNPNSFSSCKTIVAPEWHKSLLNKLCLIFWMLFKVIQNFNSVFTFINLERKANRSWIQIFKNIFTNIHLLASKLNWLHFGFSTLSIQSECVAKAIGAKMAVSLRGFDIDVFPLKHPGCYKLLWQQVDKVHVISDYLLQRAYQLGLSKETEVQIITPAVNIEKFNFKHEKVFLNSIKFLTVARLHWIKGLTETLVALAILKLKGVNFSYTIIGSGALLESLSFTIYQLNLSDSVKLIGQKSDDEVLDELKNTDYYIQYSYSEGFCNAVLEAQAVGALCIVSDGGGLVENIVNKETGWVILKRQPKLLAESIFEIINLPDSYKIKVRNQARNRVESYFSLDQNKLAFKSFYEKN